VMSKIDESIAPFLPMLERDDLESMEEGDRVMFEKKRASWGPFKLVNMSCVKKICFLVIEKQPDFTTRCGEFIHKYGGSPYALATQGADNCLWAQGVMANANQLISTKESDKVLKGQRMHEMVRIFFQQLEMFKSGAACWQTMNVTSRDK